MQGDPELKPFFDQAKSGDPQALMKLMSDPDLTAKVMAKLGNAPGEAAAPCEDEINNIRDAAK